MSEEMDPNRMLTFILSKESVYRRVKAIARTTMGPNWTWGKTPYTRHDQPPAVNIRTNLSDPNHFISSEPHFILSFILAARHPMPGQ